jgi:hypothetical protein
LLGVILPQLPNVMFFLKHQDSKFIQLFSAVGLSVQEGDECIFLFELFSLIEFFGLVPVVQLFNAGFFF